MPRATKAPVDPDDAPLERLGGGRWQTRDERFTIEPQSGTWVIVDGEQTDDLGLPLVRGPFPSLTSAKEAISTARSSGPVASPLADRIERRGRERSTRTEATERADRGTSQASTTSKRDESAGSAKATGRADRTAGRAAKPATTARADGEEPREPGWLTERLRGRPERALGSVTDCIDDRVGAHGRAPRLSDSAACCASISRVT